MFVLVRHGHAGSRSEWGGPDRERPLSARGHRQALALARVLAAVDPMLLCSSPTARCQQTLEPLGALIGLPVEDHPLLLPEADLVALSDLLGSFGRRTAVLSTHGETITRLIEHWGDVALVGAPEGRRTAKGAAWFVHGLEVDRPVLQYLAPDTPAPLARPA